MSAIFRPRSFDPHDVRHRGFHGGWIAPHRAILTLGLGQGRFFASLGFGVLASLAWILALRPVARLWTAALQQVLDGLDLPGRAMTREVSILWDQWTLLMPRIELAAGEPTRQQWWIGLVVTAVLLLGSYLLPRRHLPFLYWMRLLGLLQASAQFFFWMFPGAFPYDLGGYTEVMLVAGLFLIGLVPLLYAFTYSLLSFPFSRTLVLDLMAMAHLIVFIPLQILAHAWIVHHASLLAMPLLFWMFGLALEVSVIIGLYGWAVSWAPIPMEARRRPAARAAVLLLAGGAALVAAPARAQTAGASHLLELGASFGRYTEDLGTLDSQFVALSRERPRVDRWRVDLGRAARFEDEGLGVGASYTRHLGAQSLSLGASTGTGDVLFPEWRLDLGLQRRELLRGRVTANLGYTHIQSKAENESDGFGLGLLIGLAGPFRLGLDGHVDLGRPGDTVSRRGGATLLFGLHRRFYADVGFEVGEISYVLLTPDEAQVDFDSRSAHLGTSLYLTPRSGFSLRLDVADTDVYDVWSFTARVFREW